MRLTVLQFTAEGTVHKLVYKNGRDVLWETLCKFPISSYEGERMRMWTDYVKLVSLVRMIALVGSDNDSGS